MARGQGLWDTIKKTINSEVQDEDKLAANLALGALSKAPALFKLAQNGSQVEHAMVRFGKQIVERLKDKRLLRSAALFVGSVLVMRNFGELMAV